MKRKWSIGLMLLVIFALSCSVVFAATPVGTATQSPTQAAPPQGKLYFAAFDNNPAHMQYNVWVYDLATTRRNKLIENASQPSLSHDGKAITYKLWTPDQAVGGLYAASLNDIRNTKWRFMPSISAQRPQFAPNDSFFVFDSQNESDRLERVLVTDGANAKTILRPDMDNKDILGKSPTVALAGKNYVVAYQACEFAKCGVWERLLNGAGPVQIGEQTSDVSLQSSPDGKSIAFMSYNRDGAKDWEVYVMASDGTNVKRLTSRPGVDGQPSWSPDGQWITFVRETKPGANAWDIMAIRPDGTGEQKLVELGALDGKVMGTTPDQNQGWMEEQVAWGQ